VQAAFTEGDGEISVLRKDASGQTPQRIGALAARVVWALSYSAWPDSGEFAVPCASTLSALTKVVCGKQKWVAENQQGIAP
jgi:hypothetical protein